MFIYFVQLADFIAFGVVGLFLVFYILSWITQLMRLGMSAFYRKGDLDIPKIDGVSVILPVFRENSSVFTDCLSSLRSALTHKEIPAFEIIVVENGSNQHREDSEHFGAQYHQIPEPSKRRAIAYGVAHAKYEIAVMLDSDAMATPEAILYLLTRFMDPAVGGVVPNQVIAGAHSSIMSRLCNWYEDIRFGNTTPGLSVTGAVPCLIGRLYAVRMKPLRAYMDEFVNQYVFGNRMETGDDRVITSALLRAGYKTVYEDRALVRTECPQTIKAFAKQRLRWSRSSFRETVLTSGWLWRHPYAFIIMWSDIIMRWLFAAVIALFVWKLATGDLDQHLFSIPVWGYVVGGVIGFFVSGWLKQVPHLSRYPQDFWYTPAFLLLTTFVLTPVEWYGNLTFWRGGSGNWLTRK